MRLLPFLLLCASLTAQVQVTYLANEGVLLTSGPTKLLIDALFRDSLGDYLRHTPTTQQQLESGRPPFDNVTLALATHYHLDHWDAGAISSFLRSNPNALFASTPQAVGMIPSSLKPRVRVLWTDSASTTSLTAGSATINAVPLRHGPTQNLGYFIRMDGKTLVHLGDADADESNFAALLPHGAPDVAMIPFWWLLDKNSIQFIEQRWKPRALIALHFGKADISASAPKIRKTHPQAWLCLRPTETRTF